MIRPVPVARSRPARTAALLFGSPGRALQTALLTVLILWIVPSLWNWAVTGATWIASDRRGCQSDGACWAFIRARLGLFFYGGFPVAERWRVDVAALLMVGTLLGCLFARHGRLVWLFGLLVGVPVGDGLLLAGGAFGLVPVPTGDWGGLMLNVVLSFASIALAVPFGTLLAFGRRSHLLLLRGLSIAMIEFWRGVPLLGVLFMGTVLLPMALPQGVTVDALVRAIVVLTLFTSAYMAEVVRGGLQGVPQGQQEAALALGMHTLQLNLTVVIPQALRIAVPGIVNVTVDLFKDTTLVSVVGLFDLMGVVTQALKDPAWLGFAREGYAFAALVFFGCCLLLSVTGSMLERRTR